jgi:hypothetical protein
MGSIDVSEKWEIADRVCSVMKLTDCTTPGHKTPRLLVVVSGMDLHNLKQLYCDIRSPTSVNLQAPNIALKINDRNIFLTHTRFEFRNFIRVRPQTVHNMRPRAASATQFSEHNMTILMGCGRMIPRPRHRPTAHVTSPISANELSQAKPIINLGFLAAPHPV